MLNHFIFERIYKYVSIEKESKTIREKETEYTQMLYESEEKDDHILEITLHYLTENPEKVLKHLPVSTNEGTPN